MAQDNPFLGFFESMGVGMEAGAERRSLMERARQGKLGPGESVPSLGRTILQGITRAATPASTRLAQDELKLRAADQALDYKIQQDRLAAEKASDLNKKAAEAEKAELQLRDTVLLQDSVESLNRAAERGDRYALYYARSPMFEDPGSFDKFNKTRMELINDSSTAKAEEVNGQRSRLVYLGYAQDDVNSWPSWKVNDISKIEDDRFEDVAARSLLLPFEKGQSLLARIRQPLSMKDRNDAFNELYTATSSLNLGDSPLAKIYQGRQAALNARDDVKPWDDLVTKVTSGELKPGASATLPDGTVITLGGIGQPKIEDKQANRELELQLPQQLALMNTVDRMLAAMDEEEFGVVGAARRYGGPAVLRAEGLANFFNISLPEVLTNVYSPNIEALTQNRTALAQSVKGAVRTDMGPISNYEDVRLAPIISTLESPSATKEELVNSVASLRDILNTQQFINAHALGKSANLFDRFSTLEEGIRYLAYIRGQVGNVSANINGEQGGYGKRVPIISDADFKSYEKFLASKFPNDYNNALKRLQQGNQ